MEPLMELCDLIVQNPVQFADKLVWICGNCPPSETPNVSRSQLTNILAVARFLSKSPNPNHPHELPRSVVLTFYCSIRSSFTTHFWPRGCTYESIGSFFRDFFGYICKACELSPEFSGDVARFTGDILISALGNWNNEDLGISKAVLKALCCNFPPVVWSDANKLVSGLVEQFEMLGTSSRGSPNDGGGRNGVEKRAIASFQEETVDSLEKREICCNFPPVVKSDANKLASRFVEEFEMLVQSSPRGVGTSYLLLGGSSGNGVEKRAIALFEEETVDSLEKREMILKLMGNLLDNASIDGRLLKNVKVIVKQQFQSMVTFLKKRKRDWSEQGQLLKVRINAMFAAYQAVVRVHIKILASKRLLHGALDLFIKTAEACLFSVWRKLRACGELFSSLLSGISRVAVARNGPMLEYLFFRYKPLVLKTCAQLDTWGSNQRAMFESMLKTSCEIIQFGWYKNRSPVCTFIISILERNHYKEEVEKENQAAPSLQLKIIRLLADLNVSVQSPEVVDMILPFFVESLEEGDASIPGLLRLRLLDAVARMASLGFEKPYHEAVVLMTRSYLSKLSAVASAESETTTPEATIERVETLPAGFLLIARDLTTPTLRTDYRHRLLSLCSLVGLASESKSGKSGADFLGPLLPAVAEICSDFDPTVDVEPSLLKLFRNLWFYVSLFGLAPPLENRHGMTKSESTTLNSVGSTGINGLQAVSGPYMWSADWLSAVQHISQVTPPLVVSSEKWLENELELNALHNPGNRRGSGNVKAAVSQRAALSSSLGGCMEASAKSTIFGVKSTYLLAVAFLEVTRFSSNGGILSVGPSSTASRSAFSCVFEYLKSPGLTPVVSQCLTKIVHRAFKAAVAWLEDRMSETGVEAEYRDFTLSTHASFLVQNLSQRDEHIRDISVDLLNQLRDHFPQILWNSSCLDSLLFSVHNDPPSSVVSDPACVATIHSLYQRTLREWIIVSLSQAPCTSHGLLQEKLYKANTWQKSQPTAEVVSVLSEIKIGISENDCLTGTRPASIPAVMAAAAAASGAKLKLTEAFNLEVLSTGIIGATAKCNHGGAIAGMRRLYEIGSLDLPALGPADMVESLQPKTESLSEVLLTKFVQRLQKFYNDAERGEEVDKSSFHETCCLATALLLSDLGSDSKSNVDSFSQLLSLLCWCPAKILTPDTMETGVFIWTWLVTAAPQLCRLILAKLVNAWLWTIDTKRGLFASQIRCCGPAAKLRPYLVLGEPEAPPEKDPIEQIMAHRIWLGFLIDRFEVVQHDSEQLLLLGELLQETTKPLCNFSSHPAATGTFFTLMLLGLKFCSCKSHGNLQNRRAGLQLLEDRIYRASLCWFAHQPEWYDMNKNFGLSEAQSVSIFVHQLLNEQLDTPQLDPKGWALEIRSSLNDVKDQYHPVWGQMESYAVGREKRKQLLLMLCQHEADRLSVWAQPTARESISRLKISSEKWVEFARTAFSVDPRIALCLAARFPTNNHLKAEVTQLVQSHILEIRHIPEALPYFVTPKAIDENSTLLQQLPHWAACSITQALEFLTPVYKCHPRVMDYVLWVLEPYPPQRVTFFMPQLVQALKYDDEKLVEGYLLRATQRSDIFAHILIWNLQGETCELESGKHSSSMHATFLAILPLVRQRIIDRFSEKARDMFQREFDFFDKVTSISGALYPLPKEERTAGICRELEKIEMQGDDLYLPTAPNKILKGIQVNSGIPLQSAAKVPIMITFNVTDRDGNQDDIRPQACIFKVGDDCRQDVLALQVISLLKDIFEAVGLNLYLYPYGVLPTGPERGIIEVVPNSRSRSQMGETADGGLYEIFQQDFGPVGSPGFEAARENFIISSAGYAVASMLLQPKDRHNGNLLIDSAGRLVHIDFGFILGISPGKNMRFESAHFKLSHEMTQLIDPSGAMKSETWNQFVSLCVKGYLAARHYMDEIIIRVSMMQDSGLPCFSRGDPIGNLRKRFHPEMGEREAANYMIRACRDAYNKWTTVGYDLIQYMQQGIEK